ncbi:potassium-transporting ATPase subunit C, partial [bacterium]|nr:potassium-transporting ATPase subunit C [bacterium]
MTAIRFFLVMTLLTGVVYPVSITLISQAAFYEKAAGSFVYRDGIRVGSNLIGQEFNSDRYFKGRASAV